MIRTASTPKAPPLPDLTSLTINAEPASVPDYLTHPSLIRPKPRKPQPQPQPRQPTSPTQLQIPPSTSTPGQRKSNIKGQGRQRAHSRVSDSGWLTDEIIGGQVDDFDFEGNLGKFDKRRDWEEFRVSPQTRRELTM